MAIALGTLVVAYGLCAAENSFVRGDSIAFLVTEFTSVETAPHKSYSINPGVAAPAPEVPARATPWSGCWAKDSGARCRRTSSRCSGSWRR